MSLSEITPGVAGGQCNAIFRAKQNKHHLFSEFRSRKLQRIEAFMSVVYFNDLCHPSSQIRKTACHLHSKECMYNEKSIGPS